MLPQSHVAYTLAAYQLLKDRVPGVPEVDQRLLALAAMGPDLVDKPLATVYFYRRFKSAVLFAHTLLVHVGLAVFVISRRPTWWPLSVAFIGHALLDRLWYFPDTFYWPFRGWRFHVWQKRGSEQEDIRLAYWYAFTRRPELWAWELGGLLAGAWYIWRNRLWQRSRLRTWLRTGSAE